MKKLNQTNLINTVKSFMFDKGFILLTSFVTGSFFSKKISPDFYLSFYMTVSRYDSDFHGDYYLSTRGGSVAIFGFDTPALCDGNFYRNLSKEEKELINLNGPFEERGIFEYVPAQIDKFLRGIELIYNHMTSEEYMCEARKQMQNSWYVSESTQRLKTIIDIWKDGLYVKYPYDIIIKQKHKVPSEWSKSAGYYFMIHPQDRDAEEINNHMLISLGEEAYLMHLLDRTFDPQFINIKKNCKTKE